VLAVLLDQDQEGPNSSSVEEDEGHMEGGHGDALSQLLVQSEAFIAVRVLQNTLSSHRV